MTTDSLLVVLQGIDAISTLLWDSARQGAMPWPLHCRENSRAHRCPAMALTSSLACVSVAASGEYVMQSCRRSFGNSTPNAPSTPPSSTAVSPPFPSASSSSVTSSGTSEMDNVLGSLMKTKRCGNNDSLMISSRLITEAPTKHRPKSTTLGSKRTSSEVNVPTNWVRTGRTWSAPTIFTGILNAPWTPLRDKSLYCGFLSRNPVLGQSFTWMACSLLPWM
mmetsp:Transcript_116172/g.335535  ORF Transcript_116172/g.335535 Transcript_116172/m.335535 type:complete len:221 (-) Transcript_116172:2114-2776(-)